MTIENGVSRLVTPVVWSKWVGLLLLTSYTMLEARMLREGKILRSGFPQIVAYFLISGLQ